MAQVITTVLLDDNPNGVKIVELSNWKAEIFIIPRSQLSNLSQRSGLKKPGIYFLFGEGEKRPIVYMGQSENCYSRLASHDKEREEEQWNVAMVFTGGLHSTYIKYLESIAVKKATKVGRYEIINKTAPSENQITEAQYITADEFFKKIEFTMAFFGYPIFQEPPKEQQTDNMYYFEDVRNKDASGKGAILETGEFIVFAGSTARIRETDAFSGSGGSILRFHLKQEDSGILKQKNEKSYEFVKDYIFTSPSAASNTVAGRSTNGWDCWKDEEGKTLDENVRK